MNTNLPIFWHGYRNWRRFAPRLHVVELRPGKSKMGRDVLVVIDSFRSLDRALRARRADPAWGIIECSFDPSYNEGGECYEWYRVVYPCDLTPTADPVVDDLFDLLEGEP